jgi:hypothetical protein
VAATVAVEHQGHETAANQERKKGPEAHGYPAMLAHLDVASGVPSRHHPDRREAEQKK